MRSPALQSIWIILLTGCFDKESKLLESHWKRSNPVVAVKCDTLILRAICDYCLGDSSYYYPHHYPEGTTLMCEGFWENESFGLKKVNSYIHEQRNNIKSITIENPSGVMDRLNFDPLDSIHTLIVFGNDYNCDAIHTIPESLLKKPSFDSVIFYGVRFPSKEKTRIEAVYPRIKLVGEMGAYDSAWDQSLHRTK